jgi:hypothetical protein
MYSRRPSEIAGLNAPRGKFQTTRPVRASSPVVVFLESVEK